MLLWFCIFYTDQRKLRLFSKGLENVSVLQPQRISESHRGEVDMSKDPHVILYRCGTDRGTRGWLWSGTPTSIFCKGKAKHMSFPHNPRGITWAVCHYAVSVSHVLIPEPQNCASFPLRTTMENSWAKYRVDLSPFSMLSWQNQGSVVQESHLVFLPFPTTVSSALGWKLLLAFHLARQSVQDSSEPILSGLL